MEEVTITRYELERLIRAEHDACHLKTIIADKYENYGTFDRATIELLYNIFVGKKEDSDV